MTEVEKYFKEKTEKKNLNALDEIGNYIKTLNQKVLELQEKIDTWNLDVEIQKRDAEIAKLTDELSRGFTLSKEQERNIERWLVEQGNPNCIQYVLTFDNIMGWTGEVENINTKQKFLFTQEEI